MRGFSAVVALALLASPGIASAALPIGFDVTQAASAGPPYPTAALQIDAVAGNPPDDGIPVEILEITLENVCAPPDPCTPIPIEVFASDDGGDVGLFGSELNVDWSTPPDDGFPASGAGFELRFDMQPHPEGSAAPVMGIVPCVMPTAIGFDLEFMVELPGEGVATHVASFVANPSQPITISNVVANGPLSPAFTLSFDVTPSGPVTSGEPLFSITMSGSFQKPAAIPLLGPSAALTLSLALAGVGARRLR